MGASLSPPIKPNQVNTTQYRQCLVPQMNISNFSRYHIRSRIEIRNHVIYKIKASRKSLTLYIIMFTPYSQHQINMLEIQDSYHEEIGDKRDIRKIQSQHFEVAFGSPTLQAWMREDN